MRDADSSASTPVWWRADLVAGVAMAGLLLPEAVAYSGIAGMPPQAGVIGLFVGLIVYGLIGKSRFAIVSATSSSAAVLGAATLSVAGTDSALRATMATALVLTTGLAFLLAGAFSLGSICSFISKPVLRGFSFGLALSIVIKQLPEMVSIHPTSASLLPFAYELASFARHWNWVGLTLGLVALVLLKLMERFPTLPGALLVIFGGIALTEWLDLAQLGVGLVGPISLKLEVPNVPHLPRADWLGVGELSLALLLLLFAESYGAIRTAALLHGDDITPNRDLWAIGAANVLSGLFHGTPLGAGFSATSANEAAGATSRRSAWAAALVVALLVGTLLQLIELTPKAVLAAVVINAVSRSLTLRLFKPYFGWRRDRVVVVAAALAVVFLGVMDGLLAGIAISLAMTLRGLSEPRISELGRKGGGHDFLNRAVHPEACPISGLLLLRPEAPLFFANIERVLSEVRKRVADAKPRALVLSLEETPDLDGTTIEALSEFAALQARNGIALALVRLKDPVFGLLQTAVAASSGTVLVTGSVDDAVEGLTRS
jgi:MFS superfamily sulfate permease-like transporter